MLPGLGVALGACVMLWAQVDAGSTSPAIDPCRRAGLVDGQLRCDDELPVDPGVLCPGRSPGARPIASGDAIDTAQLCAHPSPNADEVVPGWSRMPAEDLAALGLPVDVNRASVDELTSLPRIGPTLARRIVQGRPYTELGALTRVRGIGPATLQRLRARATVGPSRL